MLRQASSRNHRNKGFKIKQALQIFFLVAICIWLLYQVKHSHEKKRAFEERNANAQNLNKIIVNEPDFFRFGRKDLPHIEAEDTGSLTEVHNKEAENEENQEEEVEERETGHEDNEDEEEGKESRREEIDEADEEKADEENEHEEESNGEEEEKDGHDEEDDKESRDDEEQKDGQVEEDVDKDGKEEVDLFESQEAREENYRRDDASSEVVHESGNSDEGRVVDKVEDVTTAGSDGSKSYEVAENTEKKVVEVENASNNSTGAGDSVTIDLDHPKDNEINTTSSDQSSNAMAAENGSVSNSTSSESSSQTNLVNAAESNTQTNFTDATHVPVSNDTTTSLSSAQENTSADNKSNTAAVDSEAASSRTNENGDGEQEGESDAAVMDENGSGGEQVESNDSSHSVIPEEVREARTDLSTLPDIETEVKITDDEASE